jgi:predicted PurR-regulated permease PerM
MEDKKIEISPKSILIFLTMVLGCVFLYLIRDILMILFIAIVVASAFDPWVTYLQKKRTSRIISAIFIYTVFSAAVILFFYFLIPSLAHDSAAFVSHFSDYYHTQLNEYLQPFGDIVPIESGDILNKIPEYIQQRSASGGIFDAMMTVVGGFVAGISIMVISLYLLMQDRGIEKFLRYVTPLRHETYVLSTWEKVQKKLSAWVRGQIFLGFTIGVMTYVGLTILKVKYALILAVIAGIFELVPMIGPIFSAIPAMVIGFSQNPFIGFMVLGLYIFIQQTENHIIVPMVMKKVTGLNRVIVILSLLIGAKLGGVLGMIVAVPLAAVVVEIFADFVEKKPLETEMI